MYPCQKETGFYSWYFKVPIKDRGLHPILDIQGLNRTLQTYRFKDWFVTIDLKDAFFGIEILPEHRKFPRFAFRGKAY